MEVDLFSHPADLNIGGNRHHEYGEISGASRRELSRVSQCGNATLGQEMLRDHELGRHSGDLIRRR